MKNNLKTIRIGKFEIAIGIELATILCISLLLFGGASAIQTATAHNYYQEKTMMGSVQYNVNGIIGAVTVNEAQWSVDRFDWDLRVSYDTAINVHDVYWSNSLQVEVYVDDGLPLNSKPSGIHGYDRFYIKISGFDNYGSFEQTIQVGNFYGVQQQFAVMQNGQSWEVYQYSNGAWNVIFTHHYSYYWSGFFAECFTEGFTHQMKSYGVLTVWSSLSVLLGQEWSTYIPTSTYPDYNWNPNLWTGNGYVAVIR